MLAARVVRSAFRRAATAKAPRRQFTTATKKPVSSWMPYGIAAGAIAAVAAGYTFSNMKKEEQKSKTTFALAKMLTVAAAQEKVPLTGLPGTKFERTFIAFKPDAIQRGLVGEMIARFEAKGFKLVGIKILVPTAEFAAKHYDDLKARPFFPGLCQYFSSGAVVAMVWEGKNAVVGGRKLIGATNPNDAAPGSLRGDFAIDVGRNLIHGSDSAESAKAEIALWFTEKEIANYVHDTGIKWVYEK